ncbi:hypothetical protein [uncultured Clostridium sp.]|uniref:hypothetical protein n=1 Tax=uncultured Clostridium sp. TaxID=59620 RepID=UPI0028E9ECD8|nr:hypothetical protein [uncultured Clostridium sp.]
MCINIISEPIYECYQLLIDFAFKKSKRFLFHIPYRLRADDSVFSLFDEMKKHLIEIIPSNSFSHTEYTIGEVYVFECNDETNLIIRNRVTSLFDWRLPKLPEDLSFINENDDVWFGTISHEKMGWITECNNTEKEYLKSIIDIDFKIR